MKEFDLTKRLRKYLAKVHDIDADDIIIDNISTTVFNKNCCLAVEYSYFSTTEAGYKELIYGRKTIDLQTLE